MTPNDILEYLKDVAPTATRRELARAFGITGGDKIGLKKILKNMVTAGTLNKLGDRYSMAEGLPHVMVVEVVDIDPDGENIAVPVDWDVQSRGQPPKIYVYPGKKGHPALGIGDQALVRLKETDEGGSYDAHIIKTLDDQSRGRITGIVNKGKFGLYIELLDQKTGRKKNKEKYDLEVDSSSPDVKIGDLVMAQTLPSGGVKRKKARLVDVIGRRDDPKAISLLSLYEAGLDLDFPGAVQREADKLRGAKADKAKRTDLRDIPLITIDGADARDFDDAVFAEETDDGGFHLIVAIADVAQYVRYGSALDREAKKRGNSTYFPDRVVPMLPEILSNDLCSLRPDGDRLCLAVHMYIDTSGHLDRYKFVRGIMRSHARMTYEQVQAIQNNEIAFDVGRGAFTKDNITALYAAYDVLYQAREKRGALDLDIPERKIVLDDAGNMVGVAQRIRLDSHRLIEEFMVLANVAAAQALEAKNTPCVYRVHEPPGLDKLDSAHEFIKSFGLTLPRGQVPKPAALNMVLKKAAGLPYSHLVSQVILRAQSQAHYGVENKGHYGLALSRYAHFTSPIRRYSDLLVHRALISAYGLGQGGLHEDEVPLMAQICEDISMAERRSMAAERAAIDRFAAAYLSEHVGAVFAGRISGVTRFGLFVTLEESGADGLVPIRDLPNRDYYVHDENAHALIGRETKTVFRLGAQVRVRIMEVEALTGSTLFSLEGHTGGADIPGAELNLSNFSPRKEQGRGGHGHKGKHQKKKRTTPKHKRRKNKK